VTAPSRARFRAPWLALPVAALMLLGGAPAYADDTPTAEPAPVVETAPPAEPPAEPEPEPSATPTPGARIATIAAEPAPASAAPLATAASPSVVVTPSTFDPAVTTSLTVTGTGFTGDGAVNGAYVVLGETADWAAGTTPLGVSFPVQIWVQSAQITDGAFTATLNVAGKLSLGTSYSVGTFAAHALAYTNRTLDTWTPITLAATPVANPVLTVSPTTIDPTIENTLTISGTGYVGDGAVNGTYIVIGQTSAWSAGTSPLGVTFDQTAWVRATSISGGAFSTTVTIPANKLSLGTTYSIGSFASQALAYSDRTLDTWQPLTVTRIATPAITLNPTTIDPLIANTVTVSGTGFVGTGAANGAYVVLGETADWAAGTTPLGVSFPVQIWVQSAQITGGAFTATLSIPAGTLTAGTSYSVGTFAAHGLAYTNRTLDTWTAFTVTGGSTGGGGTGPTTPPGTAAPRLSVSPGTVDPSAATTLTVTGTGYRGTGAANGVYVSVGSAGTWQPGEVPSQGGWVTTVWVTPANLSAGGTFTATLRIPAGALKAGGSYGVASFAAHGLSITDRSLDAWTALRLGAPGSGEGDPTGTRAAASTPPSDEGIDLHSSELTEGGEFSASASGFEPNETGILVVVYSDPVVLASDATADAEGVVRWTGRLPIGLTGSHTLTFQGSIDAGVPIEIAPRDELVCTVEGASLEWGFKESFRSYVDGAIANGEWTTSGDAGYETPAFTWSNGSGDRDADTGEALVAFTGGVRFTGHSGALDTTIANPLIEVGADSATLLLDVSGTTQDGRELVRVAVPFADLDLSGVEPSAGDGVIRLADIPAVLTAQGAEVFGTYEAGEQLDPLTLTLPAGACGETDAGEVQAAAAGDTDAGIAPWLIWLGVALLLVIAAVAAALVLRSRRA
jgi:hypothetical protein